MGKKAPVYSEGSVLVPGTVIESFLADKLKVHVCPSSRQTLETAADAVGAEMRRLISERGRAIGVFSSASSLSGFFDGLVKTDGIAWTQVIGFHLNEKLKEDEDSPRSNRRFLIERLVKLIPMAEFHGIRGEAANPEAVCANYIASLKKRPPDFAALELGENGRLASITPRGCDFNDPAPVRVVDLDDQLEQAISFTIPGIMACPKLFLIAPDDTNRSDARATIEGEISGACPASILRTHDNAHLFTIDFR